MGLDSSKCSPSDLLCGKEEDEETDDPQLVQAKHDFMNGQQTINATAQRLKLCEQSMKAIHCVHLLGSIIKNFFESNENKCDVILDDDDDDGGGIDTEAILSNILLIGSAPRDYLLHRAMNEIFIAINTRELTKLHLIHLRKYHKTEAQQKSNSQCILWRIYLNKFTDTDFNMILNRKQYEFIAECNYILNAYFVVEYILSKHIWSEFRDKLSIHRDPVTKIYECEIIDELIYEHYDLDKQSLVIFDITDKLLVYQQLFGMDRFNKESQYKQRLSRIHSEHRSQLREMTLSQSEITSQYRRVPSHPTMNTSLSFSVNTLDFQTPKTRLEKIDSLPAFQFRINDKPLTISSKNKQHSTATANVLAIELPFYKVKLVEVIQLMDFTVDTLLISLSDILNLNQAEMKHDDENRINYDFKNKIKNGMGDGYNALLDFKYKVITHPFAAKVIESRGVDTYFWKIIRYAVLLHSWRINKELVRKTKAKYHKHIEKNLNNKEFYQSVVEMMFENNICYNQSAKQFKRMFALFSMFEIHDKLKLIMAANQFNINNYLHITQAQQRNDVLQLFKDYGYLS